MRLVRRHPRQQQFEIGLGEQDPGVRRADKPAGDHVLVEREKMVEKPEGVEQPDRLGVIAQLRPAHRFPQFVHRADAAGQRQKAVGQIGKRLFAFVHARYHTQFGAAGKGDFGLRQRLGDHPDHFAAGIERALRHRAHQPAHAAAIDHADPALSEHGPGLARQRHVTGIGRGGRSAIDRDPFQARSSTISFAVALALPTTPGMPAPGCVPAPTI
jgi:hypothetical protein